MKKILLPVLGFCLLLSSIQPSLACTSAIISGRLTSNGRPLMWKHRDTDTEQNKVCFIKGPVYSFLGIIDVERRQTNAWAGTNEAGFCIMNTASYNLKDDDLSDKQMDQEGALMYKALGRCGSLADFEHFLDTLQRPYRVETNFGVMDAQGNAAYYEVNNNKYVKFDANDPQIAPLGYIVYTNHSFSGRFNKGSGYERYQTASDIFLRKSATEDFTPQWIFNNASRSFYHSILGYDLCQTDFSPEKGNGYFLDQDFIPRKSSVCSIVFEGVKPGEDPLSTIMWTILGYPPAGIAMPLWVKMEDKQPAFVSAGENGRSFLCEQATELKHKTFPITRGNGSKYFKFSLIYRQDGSGYMQQLSRVENQLFTQYNNFISSLEASGKTGKNLPVKEVSQMYEQVQEKIRIAYQNLQLPF